MAILLAAVTVVGLAIVAVGTVAAPVVGCTLGCLRSSRAAGLRTKPRQMPPTSRPFPRAGPRHPRGRRLDPDDPRDRPRAVARLWLAALAVVVLGSGLAASSRPDGRLRVTVLDVGQGDAILVEGDAGTRMLVDGGPDPDRLLVVLDERLPAWDRRIDLVVFTHPHEDHVAGLAILLERYRVRTVAEVGMHGPGPGYAAFHATLDRLGIDRRRLATGDRLRVDGTTIEVRWPPRGSVPFEPPDTGTGINNVSAVLDLRFGVRRLLLMGDVEEAIDPQLIAAGIADGGRLDLLKVAHHGSRTASTEAFLAALRPRVAVISAGTGNPYGHPTRQTLDRLAAIGAGVFRTDTDGTVTIETDGRDLRVAQSGGRAAAAAARSPACRRLPTPRPATAARRLKSARGPQTELALPAPLACHGPAYRPMALGGRAWPAAGAMSVATTNLAYFWGEDAWGMERAVRRMAIVLGDGDGTGDGLVESATPLEIWRVDAEAETSAGIGSAARLLDRIAERLGTAPLFGGGTLVMLRQPSPLLREKANRERLVALIGDVPPGNALAVTELADGGSRPSKAAEGLREAVKERGGTVREYPALTRERMERWIAERAGELGLTLGQGAARLLAERVGAFVREGDVDRRRQTELADGELEKLALLRPDGVATREDVAESVPEAIPGSSWAFLDAVALRHPADAARIAERLLDGGTPMPVLLAQVHRRLRELVVVRDHLAAGTRPAGPRARAEAATVSGAEAGRAGWCMGARRAGWRPRRSPGARPREQGHQPRWRIAGDVRRALGARAPGLDRRLDRARSVGATSPVVEGSAAYSADDQASSWRTRSDSMAKTQRLSERSSSSISSGSMYSWWQSSQRPPGMPKQSRSTPSSRRKVVSKRVLTS